MKNKILTITTLFFLSGCNNIPEISQTKEISNTQEEKILPKTPGSFTTAKKILYENIHGGHLKTFYCGCGFSKDKKIDGNCNIEYRKNKKRSERVEAEHIFPASHFGQHKQCWREKLCTDSHGKAFGGRRCCNKIDPSFEAAHNDLHNLQPSVGEINGDRSNFRFAEIRGEARNYGACNFEVDFKTKHAEPTESVQGDIARTYFYMRDMYNIQLSKQQTKLFEAWNTSDPVDEWERERNERIKRIQGIGNKYISN